MADVKTLFIKRGKTYCARELHSFRVHKYRLFGRPCVIHAFKHGEIFYEHFACCVIAVELESIYFRAGCGTRECFRILPVRSIVKANVAERLLRKRYLLVESVERDGRLRI